MLKSELKQIKVAPDSHTSLSCFELDINLKFPLLRLLQFDLGDLKSTIFKNGNISLHVVRVYSHLILEDFLNN